MAIDIGTLLQVSEDDYARTGTGPQGTNRLAELVGAQVRSSPGRDQKRQEWIPNFTDDEKIAAAGEVVDATGVRHVPYYIQPTKPYNPDMDSPIGNQARLEAPKYLPPSGATVTDKLRLAQETLAGIDKGITAYRAAKIAPLDQSTQESLAKMMQLQDDVARFAGTSMAKQAQEALEMEKARFQVIQTQREFVSGQMELDPQVASATGDKQKIVWEIEDLTRQLADERKTAAQVASERRGLDNSVERARRLKEFRSTTNADIRSLPADMQAMLEAQAPLLARRIELRDANAPEAEQKAVQDQLLASRTIYAAAMAKLDPKLASLASQLAVRQERVIGFDEAGVDYKYAAAAKAREHFAALSEERRKLRFTREQGARQEDWFERHNAQVGQIGARDKRREEREDKLRLERRAQLLEDTQKRNAEFDRRLAESMDAQDASKLTVANRDYATWLKKRELELADDRSEEGRTNAEWDRRQARLQAERAAGRGAQAEREYAAFLKERAILVKERAQTVSATNAEWDRRQGLIDATRDENARQTAVQEMDVWKQKEFYKLAGLPERQALELDQAQRLYEARHAAELTGSGLALHDRELADWWTKFNAGLTKLPIVAAQKAREAAQALEARKELKVFSAEVDRAYAKTPQDIQVEADARKTGAQLAEERIVEQRAIPNEQARLLFIEANNGGSFATLSLYGTGEDKKRASADAQTANYLVTNGVPLLPTKVIGLAPEQQDFVSRVLLYRQTQQQGKQGMSDYTSRLLGLREDPELQAKLFPMEKPEGKLDPQWELLRTRYETATSQSARDQALRDMEQYKSVVLGRSPEAGAAVHRITTGFVGDYFTNVDNAHFVKGLTTTIPATVTPVERKAYMDVIKTMGQISWDSYDSLIIQLANEAAYERVSGPTLALPFGLDAAIGEGPPMTESTGIGKDRAVEIAVKLVDAAFSMVDQHSEGTLTKAGYTSPTGEGAWKVMLTTASTNARTRSLLETLGINLPTVIQR